MQFDKFQEFGQALLAQIRAGRTTMLQLDTDASGLRKLAWPLCTRGLLSRPPRSSSRNLRTAPPLTGTRDSTPLSAFACLCCIR